MIHASKLSRSDQKIDQQHDYPLNQMGARKSENRISNAQAN